MKNKVELLKKEIEVLDKLPNTSRSRIEGIKKMNIWYKGNADSMVLIKDLLEVLIENNLKIIAYVNGSQNKFSPTITLITVKEDLERPSKSAEVPKGSVVSYDRFINRLSIGTGSKQYKLLREILDHIKSEDWEVE